MTRQWETCAPVLGELAIEADGHDFHEKTPGQASGDRQRDRDLLREGVRTIRFTGTDVNNDPLGCVKETAEQIGQMAQKIFDDHLNARRLEELIVGDSKYSGPSLPLDHPLALAL